MCFAATRRLLSGRSASSAETDVVRASLALDVTTEANIGLFQEEIVMRKLFIASLILACSPLLFAQPGLRHPVGREHSAFRASKKTVLLRYDTSTSAVGAVAETVSLDGVI